MRVVIDCNIVVSAALTGGACRKVIAEAVRHHEIVLSYSSVVRRNTP
jgi:predicted nucleic acid-binding protein